MSTPRQMGTVVLGLTAVLAGALAVTYLLVACQSLPSLLGPVAGDTHPRTKLGAAFLLLAVLLAGGAVMTARLRRDRR